MPAFCKIYYTDEEIDELTEKMLFLVMSLYVTLSSPKMGMCFPKSCSSSDINENYSNRFAKSQKDVTRNSVFQDKIDRSNNNISIKNKSDKLLTWFHQNVEYFVKKIES